MFGRLWCWVFFFWASGCFYTLLLLLPLLRLSTVSCHVRERHNMGFWFYFLVFSAVFHLSFFLRWGFSLFFFFSLFLFDASRVFSAWGCHFRGLYFVARFWFFCVSITIIIIKASFIIIEHTNFFLITVLLRLYISLFN